METTTASTCHRSSVRSHAFALPAWQAAGLLLCLLMSAMHVYATPQAGLFPDVWRDLYWALAIVDGKHLPLSGPPIYELFELGPWWYYVLALPIRLTGRIEAALVLVQALAALKYWLAWRIGSRLLDARMGLAFAGSLAVAGWSTIPLVFATHSALSETAILCLAWATWRCWRQPSAGNSVLLGLAASFCLHAHPTTLLHVGTAFLVLLLHGGGSVRHLLTAAAICVASLAPPWFDASPVHHDHRPIVDYVARDIGTDAWRRVPMLGKSLVVNGAWNGFMLLTPWRLPGIHQAWLAYCLCLATAIGGFLWLRSPRFAGIRRLALAATLFFVVQVVFLVLVRPVTPMWMVSPLLPALALVLALGWYGWFQHDRGGIAGIGVAAFLLYLALALAPFAYFLKPHPSYRYLPDANPFGDAVQTGDRYVSVKNRSASSLLRDLRQLGGILCEDAVLHGSLSETMEHALGVPVRDACGKWPDLRFGGREGPVRHLAGMFLADAGSAGLEPDRRVGPMALYSDVRPIAPLRGGRLAELQRRQIHPESVAREPTAVEYAFEAGGRDVVLLTNRFRWVAPMTMSRARAGDRPARVLADHDDTILLACDACGADGKVTWSIGLQAVEENLDVVVLRGAPVHPKR